MLHPDPGVKDQQTGGALRLIKSVYSKAVKSISPADSSTHRTGLFTDKLFSYGSGSDE